jgi:hypothetical protein
MAGFDTVDNQFLSFELLLISYYLLHAKPLRIGRLNVQSNISHPK